MSPRRPFAVLLALAAACSLSAAFELPSSAPRMADSGSFGHGRLSLTRRRPGVPVGACGLRARHAARGLPGSLASGQPVGIEALPRLAYFVLAAAAVALLLPGRALAAAAPAAAAPVVADPRRVVALLLGSSAFGMWAEEHTRIGATISGAMITFFASMGLSAAGLLPSAASHPVYGIVWEHLVPLAVAQMMLTLDARDVKAAVAKSGSMLTAFLVASIGTFAGTLAASMLVRIPHGWQLASTFCATYIGGTLNFIAVADAVGMLMVTQSVGLLGGGPLLKKNKTSPVRPGLRDSAVLAAGFSADMLMMAVYFSGLFFLAKRADRQEVGLRDDGAGGAEPVEGGGEPTSPLGLAACLALGAGIVWVGYGAAGAIGGVGGVPVVTGLALLAACALPGRARGALGGAPRLVAALCTQAFFAVIGASTDVGALLSFGALGPIVAFVGVLLAVHAAVLALVARRWLKLPMSDILLASNAAVGGPATAAAMAGAMKWTRKASPAVLCGSVGYAVGTYVGLFAGWLCKWVLL